MKKVIKKLYGKNIKTNTYYNNMLDVNTFLVISIILINIH